MSRFCKTISKTSFCVCALTISSNWRLANVLWILHQDYYIFSEFICAMWNFFFSVTCQRVQPASHFTGTWIPSLRFTTADWILLLELYLQYVPMKWSTSWDDIQTDSSNVYRFISSIHPAIAATAHALGSRRRWCGAPACRYPLSTCSRQW